MISFILYLFRNTIITLLLLMIDGKENTVTPVSAGSDEIQVSTSKVSVKLFDLHV